MQNFVYNTEQVVSQQQIKETLKPFDISTNIYPTTNVDLNLIDDIDGFSERLVATANHYRSYSCTANQVGINFRMFIAGVGDNFVGFFNPVILDDFDGEEILDTEVDTISYPGLILNVKRFKKIKLQYQDFNGELHTTIFEGLTARIIQQCIDTLNGIPFTHRVSKLQLTRAKKALDKKIKLAVKTQMNQLRVAK